MTAVFRGAVAGLASLALLWACPSARAWVPERTSKSGKPIHWMHSNCIPIRVNSKGTDDLPAPAAVAAVKRALDNWQKAIAGCSYLRWDLRPDSPDAVKQFNGPSGPNENAIWWDENWPGGEDFFEPIALTSTMYVDEPASPSDGQLLDADVTLNGKKQYSDSGGPEGFDIENVVTHELGHLLGLGHSCGGCAINADGKLAPGDCNAAEQWVRDSTMYPLVAPGMTKLRTPEPDDIAGVCETYPKELDPGRCVPPAYDPHYKGEDDGGCAVAGPRGAGARAPGLLLVGLLVLGVSLRAAWRP